MMSFCTVTSGGTSSAATHSSLAYLVLCETVCRWKSSLCLFSPTWWFRLVGVPEACQVQSPWWCQIFPHQDRLSSAKRRNHICLFSHSVCRITQIRCKTPWNVFYCRLWFVKQIVDVCVLHDELHPKACNCNIWLHFAFLALPFFYQPVCVLGNTYTLFTHAAGRIPGKHFKFDLLTFKLCFPCQPFLSAVSSSFPTALYTPSLAFPVCI